MHINFQYYKPSEIETLISSKYQEYGIWTPQDLTIQAVSDLFDIHVISYDGPVFADWEDDEYSFIFLNRSKTVHDQKNDFFHELCHPLRHCGQQNKLPKLFQELQEMQASQFQLVAAMPIYLVQQVPLEKYWEQYINNLAHYFEQPTKFVERRMQQVANKINYNHYWAQVSKIV